MTEQPTLIGFDYETRLFGPGDMTPNPICLSYFINDSGSTELTPETLDEVESFELATAADGDLIEVFDQLLDPKGEHVLVGANVAYDLAVGCYHYARQNDGSRSRFNMAMQAVAEGRCRDIQVREKLLNLASTGKLDMAFLPGGQAYKIKYNLAELTYRYLGIKIQDKATKEEKQQRSGDAWQLNYQALEDIPLASWPAEAVSYSLLDSVYPTLIYNLQEIRRQEIQRKIGRDPLKTQDFRCQVNFSLFLMTAFGIEVDAEEHAKVKAFLAEELKPENLSLLTDSGILRPAVPPRPYKNGATDSEGNPKMTKGKPESVNKKALEEFVTDLEKKFPDQILLENTPKGSLKIDKDFLDSHYHLSPTLAQYRRRQKVQKLVTTELPRMEWPHGSGIPSKVVHPSFDCLKETGRTSSFASKATPSMNCQNVDPRARGAFVAREGYVLCSNDFSGMELGTLAQTCLNLFGFSVLADKLRAGYDAHAYLGSQLALSMSEEFPEVLRESGVAATDPDAVYEAFVNCKTSEDPDVRKFYKHWRKFAKPTGLGYPGGLGAPTFIAFARSPYGVEVDLDTAKAMKRIWLDTYPEMRQYFNWINGSCEDPWNSGYCYTTPLGMYRAGASYCAAANGIGLQSPSAEGALMAVNSVVDNTFCNPDSVLYPDANGERHRPLMFIHDEIVSEVRLDVAHECAYEIARLMEEAMEIITPQIPPKAEPVLMYRWNKNAEPVLDENGRLVPWIPEQQEENK